jgi:hypothetical protein
MAPAPGALETLVGRLNALRARGLIGEHAIGGGDGMYDVDLG